MPRDALLDVLACAIEHNPCEKEKWACLVRNLGAFESAEKYVTCRHEKGTNLAEGRWWGAHRVAEWEDQFFHAPDILDSHSFIGMSVKDVVATLLPNDFHIRRAQCVGANRFEGAPPIPDPKDCMGWIWDPLDNAVGVDFDDFIDIVALPESLPATIKVESERDFSFVSEIEERLAFNPTCEALCMKILVARHMGVQTHFVCDSIWWLAANLWQSTQESDYILSAANNHFADGLAWLSMHGIDLSLHLQCKLKRSEAKISESY